MAFVSPVSLTRRPPWRGARAHCARVPPIMNVSRGGGGSFSGDADAAAASTAPASLNGVNGTDALRRGADLRAGEMLVRFVNGPDGDVITGAQPGEVLLAVGDAAGVTIPRGCVSGLCGACTVDVVDRRAVDGSELQTVRACQTTVVDVDGRGELVVDLERMKKVRARGGRDPMARFNNLDTDYVAGAAPVAPGWMRERPCTTCGSAGDVECYACEGAGVEDDEPSAMCLYCSGSGKLRCADCQGVGMVKT